MNKNNGKSYDKSRVIFCILAVVIIIILIMKCFGNNGEINIFKEKVKISIEPSNDITLNIGKTTKLVANVNVENADVYWTSSDLSVAKVTNGHVTGVSYGSATITATYVDSDGIKHSANSNITVGMGDANSSLKSVNFPQGDLYMPIGNNFHLDTILTPANAFVYKKEFSSSDVSVINVDDEGNIKSLKDGSARISVTINDKYKTTMGVYVSSKFKKSEILITPTSISFNNDTVTLKIGESKKLDYSIAPRNVDLSRLTWFSSESRVATVDQSGKVTAKSLGEVLIRVSTFDGKSADIIVVVE